MVIKTLWDRCSIKNLVLDATLSVCYHLSVRLFGIHNSLFILYNSQSIMLKIRLARTGKKNQPSFRIVVTEHTSAPKSNYLAVVGHYNPFTKKLVIKEDQATSWMAKGALPSGKVASLMVKAGLTSPVVERLALKRKTSMKKRMEKMALAKTSVDQPKAEISAPSEPAKIEKVMPDETKPETALEQNSESTSEKSSEPVEGETSENQ